MRAARLPSPALRALCHVWRSGVLAVALGCAGAGAADVGTDYTEMSLEQLMQVELPPVGSANRFTVSATAIESCTVSVSDLDFGQYDPLRAAPADAVSTLSVACTVDTVYRVGLDAGRGAGASVARRRMSRDTHTLDYMLFRDAGRSEVWGQTPGVDTLDGIGSGIAIEHRVYGRIAPRQPVRGGQYADIVTVTLFY